MALHMSIVLSVLLFGSIVSLAVFSLVFAQDHGHFTALELAAIVCYSLSFLLLLPGFAFLSSVGAILVIIDRVHRHSFNAVTIAYIAVTFGSLLPGTLYAIIWDVALKDYAYKAWLATFEEDWDTNGKYRFWWWIFGVNKKLVSIFNEQLINRGKTGAIID